MHSRCMRYIKVHSLSVHISDFVSASAVQNLVLRVVETLLSIDLFPYLVGYMCSPLYNLTVVLAWNGLLLVQNSVAYTAAYTGLKHVYRTTN